MKSMFLPLLGLLTIAGCSKGQPSKTGEHAQLQRAAGSEETAVVTGFGGPGGRRGRVNVYLRSGELTGVIRGILAEELNCSVGDRVPAKQSGKTVVALQGAWRKRVVL